MDSAKFLEVDRRVMIPRAEIELRGVRAQGPGGQNVNKVSSAVHLRFDVINSSLPQEYKDRLISLNDQRISRDGVINIKAQAARSRLANEADAMSRLVEIVAAVGQLKKKRKATKPKISARRRRVDEKTKRGQQKRLRGKVKSYD